MKSFRMKKASGDDDVTKEALVAIVVLAIIVILILTFVGIPGQS